MEESKSLTAIAEFFRSAVFLHIKRAAAVVGYAQIIMD